MKSVFTVVKELQRGKSDGKIMPSPCKCSVVNVTKLWNWSAPCYANIQYISLTHASKWRTYLQRSEMLEFTYGHMVLNYDWFVFIPSLAFSFWKYLSHQMLSMPQSTHKLVVGVCGWNIYFEVNAKFDQDLLQLVSQSCLYFFLGR